MLTVDEALELVARNTGPLKPRRVTLGEAAGLVLAEDITSEVNSPPYDKAMMDGYAVRSSDEHAERRVLEEITAGDVPHLPVTPGTASRIMTGAPLPDGADAVVPVEQTELVGDTVVRITQSNPRPGQHVLPLGCAMRAGDTVLRAGAMVRPVEIAILAEVGRGMVSVTPRPRVAILPTGNELVAAGEKLRRGQIRNSNGPMLTAATHRAGATAVELGVARDERGELVRWIEQGLAADVLVLSGGVSAGKLDLVPEVLAQCGVEQVFHKVALRPGKPLWFGVKRDKLRCVLVFGLPGNPVSSLVCFELFVRPAIAALAGRGFVNPAQISARLNSAYEHAGGRAACLPARLTMPAGDSPASQVATVEILPWHGSADLAALAHANGLARLSAEKQSLAAGTPLDVLLL